MPESPTTRTARRGERDADGAILFGPEAGHQGEPLGRKEGSAGGCAINRPRSPRPRGREARREEAPEIDDTHQTLKILEVVVAIVLLVLSLGIHEAAHGWVAWKCGDPTAKNLGRITLNPLPHIDLFMTILLPLMIYWTSGGRMLFGGAKPVPVNFHGLRRPWRDMALVAIAGPLSNFLLAGFFFALIKLLVQTLGVWGPGDIGVGILQKAVYFNLLLAAFNLLPIPPLDGSRIVTWLLPSGIRETYGRLDSIGLILVLVALQLGPVRRLLEQTMLAMAQAVEFLVTLGGIW